MKKYSEEEFLNKVLSIASVGGTDDEGTLARFLADYLREHGVNAAVQEIDSRHANVIAVVEGKTQEKVVLNGHLDTAPYGRLSEWNTVPDQPVKKNGCIYARGASAMKSGLAAMVYTVARMKEKGHIPKQTVYFIGTCGKESGNLGAHEIQKGDLMEHTSLLLIAEPTGGAVGIAQKGCIRLRIKVKGEDIRSACPQNSANAAECCVFIFEGLKQELSQLVHPVLGSPSVQIIRISGEESFHLKSDEAEILLDIRTIPGIERREIVEWVQKLYEKFQDHCNHCKNSAGDICERQLSIKIQTEYNLPSVETDKASPWVKRLEWNMKGEGMTAAYAGVADITDAPVLAGPSDETTIIFFGPGEADLAYKPDEYVEIQKYLQYIRVLCRLF